MRQPSLISSNAPRQTFMKGRLVSAKQRIMSKEPEFYLYIIVGTVLALLVLAYLFGDYTEEIRRGKQIILADKRLEQLYSHLTMCKSDTENFGNIKENITTSENRLLVKKESLIAEYDTLKKSISLESTGVKSCEGKLIDDHMDHAGENFKSVIAHIKESQDKVKELIDVAKKAREIYRDDMKSLIRAYELEIMEVMEKVSKLDVSASPYRAERGPTTTIDAMYLEQAKKMRQGVALEGMKHGVAVLNDDDIAILAHAMKVQRMRDINHRDRVAISGNKKELLEMNYEKANT